jgi:integrase
VPTVEEFAPRFLDGHARANRQKPSSIAAKELILRVHIVPMLGTKRLNEITNEDVQRLKRALAAKAAKTVNNVLTVLNTLLKKAVEWGVIDQMPCTIKLLRVSKPAVPFYDFDEYERLVDAAQAVGQTEYIIALLAGEGGLRSGEIVALEWSDLDLTKRLICIQRNEWEGKTDSTKGGRLRYVPMTARLAAALRDARHLRGPRVLYRDDGRPLTEGAVACAVIRSARRAGLPGNGPHRLRHSFCSHLAMRGAPMKAIQELAGHANITTTQRYAHLTPATIEHAIRLLESGNVAHSVAASSSGSPNLSSANS